MRPEGAMPRQRRGTRFSPFFLCTAKKKPLAVKRKRQRGICVGTNSTSLTLPQAAGLVRFVVPPFPARIASLDSRGSPFFGIPLKRPRRGLMPPSWIIPEVWFVQSVFQASKNAMQMRMRQTGEVVEILCGSFDFHTSNIQRALTKRLVLFIVRSGNPILRSPVRAFLDCRCNDNM